MINLLRILYFLLFLSAIFIACEPNRNRANEELNIPPNVKRYGQVIGVKSEKLEYYRELHQNPWPCVIEKIRESNIRNYTIYLQDDHLFAYFEYIGDDFADDMKKMAEDTCTQRWWKETDPCQEPISNAKQGDWWTNMEEVFHSD